MWQLAYVIATHECTFLELGYFMHLCLSTSAIKFPSHLNVRAVLYVVEVGDRRKPTFVWLAQGQSV